MINKQIGTIFRFAAETFVKKCLYAARPLTRLPAIPGMGAFLQRTVVRCPPFSRNQSVILGGCVLRPGLDGHCFASSQGNRLVISGLMKRKRANFSS